MKGTILTLIASSTLLWTACSGPVTAEAVPEPAVALPTEPAPPPAEVSVFTPTAPESEPAPTPEPAPTDSMTPAPTPLPEIEPQESQPAPEPEPKTPARPEVGSKAPDFTLVNPDGTASPLSNLNRPILLNFWNTGCQPCRNEMPYLEEIYEANGNSVLFLLAINIGQNPESVKAFLEENKLKLPVAFDTKATLARAYQIQYIPTTFLIDRDGIIQDKVIGSFRDKEAIEKKLAAIMPADQK